MMERLTKRERAKVEPDIEIVIAKRGVNITQILDRLADYEDAKERGELARLIAPNGCNFCRGVRFMAGNFEGSFQLDEYHNEVIQTDGTTDFYFCPMCGRPLTSREAAEAALVKEADQK